MNNKKEKVNFKTKKFDFSSANIKTLNIDKKAHGANTTSLSFEFISKTSQNGVLFGQSLPTQSNKDELTTNMKITNANKRPLSFLKKKNNAIQTNSNKSKKTSISLNSLQNIHPVGE